MYYYFSLEIFLQTHVRWFIVDMKISPMIGSCVLTLPNNDEANHPDGGAIIKGPL